MRQQTVQQKRAKSTMYVVVFESIPVKIGVLLLFSLLILQPISFAFASEEGAANSAEEADVVVEQTVEAAEENTNEVDTSSVEEVEMQADQTVSSEEHPSSPQEDASEEVVTVPVEEEQSVEVDVDTQIQETLENVTTEEEVTPDSENATSTEPQEDYETPEGGTDGTGSGDETATTTQDSNNTPELETQTDTPETPESDEEVLEEVPVTIIPAQINDLNRYQFSDTECVSVGDESYYCSRVATSTETHSDGVYSEQDTFGDYEIYIKDGSSVEQITDNQVDDLNPHFDPVSESLVWHRLIDGRYEIVSYDLQNEEERVLTENTVNDMEPTRSGAYTVWQRWNDNNWDIMLFDGASELQITQSAAHDVAPYVQGEYVIWQTTSALGETAVGVYEIETGLTNTINDDEGGRVYNPRFVLVYDTEFENGDQITKGYDPHTGELVPLSSTPAPESPKIPAPDPVGETRALLQTKSTTSRDDFSENDNTPQGGDPLATTTPQIVASSTATTTATSAEEIPVLTVASTTPEVLPLTEMDLIVEPYIAASSTQQEGG